MPSMSVEVLRAAYFGLARHFGADDEEAELFCQARLAADLRGRDTQGAAAFAMSRRLFESGAARFGKPPTIITDTGALLVLDGHHGPGEVVASRAMDMSIIRAKRYGICATWLRNTNDFFMASAYTLRACEHGCVGIAMSNSPAFVAAWGGARPLFGTNPISLAVPSKHEPPIVIDMSAGSLSHGKVVLAARSGQSLPEASLVDNQGRMIRDPRQVIADPLDRDSSQIGAILPLGPKGMNWIMLVEVFAGLLSGMSSSREVNAQQSAEKPSRIGQFLMAIDVEALMPLEQFTAEVDALVAVIAASPCAEGFEHVAAPGATAAQQIAHRRKEGVPMDQATYDQVIEAINTFGFR